VDIQADLLGHGRIDLADDRVWRHEFRQLLSSVLLGLTKEEIAVRLGITLDGVKYHVSQILTRIGVSSREEAVALPEEAALLWWARALAWSKESGAPKFM
jgi:DNA-binding CsgD family transcriptional regulator